MENGNQTLLAALVKAQLEIKPPIKDKVNPRFKSSYASLDAIYNACRGVLAKHGLVLTHSIESIEGKTYLKTSLLHVSGESLSTLFPMMIEQQTSQGLASARTYACRYSTASLLALPSDEDDDAEKAEQSERVIKFTGLSGDMKKKIEDAVGEDIGLMNRILKTYRADSLDQVGVGEFEVIMKKLAISKRDGTDGNG